MKLYGKIKHIDKLHPQEQLNLLQPIVNQLLNEILSADPYSYDNEYKVIFDLINKKETERSWLTIHEIKQISGNESLSNTKLGMHLTKLGAKKKKAWRRIPFTKTSNATVVYYV